MAAATNEKLLVTLTAAELEALVETRVRAAVRDEVQKLLEPRFLTTKQVALMLAVSTKTVLNLVRREGLPVARFLGNEPRFERDEVVAWMRATRPHATPRSKR